MIKQTFNLHTHTARCGHAAGMDEQYIQSAIEAGFTQLGFSDHIPLKELRRADCRMFYEHKDEYLDSIRKLKEQYKDKIDIRVGYEIEFLMDHLEYLQQMRKDCDYMILGQHCKFIGYEYDCYCDDEDIAYYVNQIEQAVQYGLVTYIAHPDYFMLGRRAYSKACHDAAHRIANISIANDIPLEINLNGFHYGKKYYQFYQGSSQERYPYPFREFWEIISMYGCKVCYGYDAHTPIAFQEVDRLIKAQDILQGLPLNFIETSPLK